MIIVAINDKRAENFISLFLTGTATVHIGEYFKQLLASIVGAGLAQSAYLPPTAVIRSLEYEYPLVYEYPKGYEPGHSTIRSPCYSIAF
jgi:hypothetical protein